LDATLSIAHTKAMALFLRPLEVKMKKKSMENGPIVSNAHIVVAFDVLQSQNELRG